MPDASFADPRLAAVYDDIDGDRNDLDPYEAIADELGVRRVLDVGCGTGVFACRLARRGLEVTGVDPATASLDIARMRPGAEGVTWVLGDATTPLPPDVRVPVDLATMTGNVAQVFVEDDEWHATLGALRRVIRPGGHLVFETRDPAVCGWEEWTRSQSISQVRTSVGPVESWVELTQLDLPFVSFRWTYRFLADDTVLVSDSTLRFRGGEELTASLIATGYDVVDVRDAPDRPGREMVFIARALDA